MKALAKRDFCISLGLFAYNPKDITWLDETGVAHLTAETFARFDLEGSNEGWYNRVEVAIIHQTRGCLDRKTFRFNDYFEERIDDRRDPHRQDYYPTSKGFLAWAAPAGPVEWYIAEPSPLGLARLQSAVVHYLGCFR